MTDATKIAVVTGAGGFLGKALARRLLSDGFEVRAIQRGDYPELTGMGVRCFKEDLSEPGDEFHSIFEDVQVVFHVAAKVDMWGPYEDFHAVNVVGTEKLLAASVAAGVKAFVFTSSPSVIASGKDLRGVDESVPYPDSYKANYPKTKAIAEQKVLAANSLSLRTCALRPHLIWGPDDTNLIPTVLERARAGRLVQVGSGENIVDFTFIDDCVEAHVCAMRALLAVDSAAAGKSFFISQGDPVPMWDWINQILERHNLPKVTRSVNTHLAYGLACVFEFFARLLPGKEPLLSRFLVEEMSTDHYFDISRARELLGFTPSCSTQSAMDRVFPASP